MPELLGRRQIDHLTVVCSVTWGLFLESPGNFSGPESHSKVSNLMITELFYSRIPRISTRVPFTQEVQPYTLIRFKIQMN